MKQRVAGGNGGWSTGCSMFPDEKGQCKKKGKEEWSKKSDVSRKQKSERGQTGGSSLLLPSWVCDNICHASASGFTSSGSPGRTSRVGQGI